MTRYTRLLITALALSVLGVGSTGIASAEPVFVPASESLYISAGCPPDATGTCTSTRWLGKKPGDATSNFVTSITPVDEVFYQADGSLNWRDYASDDSLLAAGYPLRAAETIKATVGLEAEGVAINNTVHARVEATTGTGEVITFGPLQQMVTMTPASTADVKFDFDIPDQLEGKVVKSLTFFLAMHGVNAQGGYINQEGGSTVELPYWREVV